LAPGNCQCTSWLSLGFDQTHFPDQTRFDGERMALVGEGCWPLQNRELQIKNIGSTLQKLEIVFLYRNLLAPDSLMDQLLKRHIFGHFAFTIG
jgi:hypothetical protein